MATYLPSHKPIQIRRTRREGHCWRNKDEFISNVLLWTPGNGRASGGRPSIIYMDQLCADTGCSQEDLLETKADRDELQGRLNEIRAVGRPWW